MSMFLNNSNTLSNGKEIIFFNKFAQREYTELMNKIMDNMLNDLSIITGLEPQEIMEDYILLNEESVFDEIFKEEKRKSLVLCIAEKIND